MLCSIELTFLFCDVYTWIDDWWRWQERSLSTLMFPEDHPSWWGNVVKSESYNWNNVVVGQQMSPWRHAPVRRLTRASHDQHCVTAGRPYKAMNSTQMSTWLLADQQARWLAELWGRTFLAVIESRRSERTFYHERRDKTRWRTISNWMLCVM